MSKQIKSILFGMVLCLLGAVFLDLHMKFTGGTLLSLGGLTIFFGPLAVSFDEE